MKKSLLYLLFVVIIGSGLVGWWSYQRYFKVEKQKIVEAVVEKGSIEEVVRVRGELVADQEYDLGWSLNGVVAEVNVVIGDKVEKTEQLAKLDTVAVYYESLKKRATYEIDYQQVRLDKIAAKKDLDNVLLVNTSKVSQARTKVLDTKQYLEDTKLYFQGVSVNYAEGDVTYDQAKQTLAAAQNGYREAQDAYDLVKQQASEAEDNARQLLSDAELAVQKKSDQLGGGAASYNRADVLQAEDKLDKSVLRAPVDGIVTEVDVLEGEIVSLGQRAVAIMSKAMVVEAEVSELEIGRIKIGNEVKMRLDALPEGSWLGQVVLIKPKGAEEDGDKFYKVRIKLDPGAVESQQLIRPGMSAGLVIKISTRENVLKIPEFYVEKEGEKEYVLVVEEGETRAVEIVTGVSDGEFIEVIEGLASGQVIGIIVD